MENRKEADAAQSPEETDALRQEKQASSGSRPPREPETELTDVMPPL